MNLILGGDMKFKVSILIALMVFSSNSELKGDSYIITSPEYNVRNATHIVDVTVIDIQYTVVSRSSFAIVRLKVGEWLVGDGPEEIVIRRVDASNDHGFQRVEWLPDYKLGERFITTLLEHEGQYTTLGLYNGKFNVVDDKIDGTGITVETFRDMDNELRVGTRESLPASLVKQGNIAKKEPYLHHTSKMEVQSADCPIIQLIDDEFRVWDFTWLTTYIPANIRYNESGKPSAAPSSGSMATLFNLAYQVWDDNNSFFSYQNMSPFTTTDVQNNDNKNVVFWADLGAFNEYARVFPYPNTEDKILNCDTDGRASNISVDIRFNSNSWVPWHFGETALTSRTNDVDFVEVLAHELGHGMGLAHSFQTSSIMHGTPFGGYHDKTGPVRGLGNGDKAANIYQHSVNTLSGTLPSHPIVLSASTDNFTVSSNLTLPSSGQLQINPGKTVEFSSGSDLII